MSDRLEVDLQDRSVAGGDAFASSAAIQSALGNSAIGSSNEAEQPATQSVFSLSRVQYSLNGPLSHLCCSNNALYLAIAASPVQIVRINLENSEDETSIVLPAQGSSSASSAAATTSGSQKLRRLYLDHTGQHLLICTAALDNYYCYAGWPTEAAAAGTGSRRVKARLLSKLKGLSIDSVAWAPNNLNSRTSSNASTGEVLLGTSDGRIFEACFDGEVDGSRTFSRAAHDRFLRPILLLQERQAIVGLKYHLWQREGHSRRRLAIVVTTGTRILQYCSKAAPENSDDSPFEISHQVFKEASPKSLELPGNNPDSELHFWHAPAEKGRPPEGPRSVAWSTGPGIYHGSLSYSAQEPGDGLIDSAQLLPYPALDPPSPRGGLETSTTTSPEHENPISMALTEHHFVLAYASHIRAIRILDDKLVYEETLELQPGERILGLVTDRPAGTYWLFSDRSIFELSVVDEDRDIWLVHLARQAYDTALQHAKKPSQRDLVLTRKADAYNAAGRYIQAADLYAQTSKSFEEVVLKFAEKSEKDALRSYLSSRLSRLQKRDGVQRLMLATWLLENTLGKINELEDAAFSEGNTENAQNLDLERSILQEDLKAFLKNHLQSLDSQIVYDLVISHGRADLMLHFASLAGDHDRIVSHWISEEDWARALDALNRQNDLNLYYKFAPALLRHATEATIECFQRQPALDLYRLLPALLSSHSTETSTPSALSGYLERRILQSGSGDSAAGNALLAMYASDSSEGDAPLLHLLERLNETKSENLPYDLDYALRLTLSNQCYQASIYIYGQMAMWENAVDLALLIEDIALAKVYADRPASHEAAVRKQLWLKVAAHVVGQQGNVESAANLLEGASLLQIEDILPFFPDFVVIDDFKDKICVALDKYSSEIGRLKEEMQDANASADVIKQDISDLSGRLVVLDAAERCTACSAPLMTRQFYVFPCQHSFHADCLIREVTPLLPQHSVRRLLDLQGKLAENTTAPSQTSQSATTNPAFAFLPRNKVATMGYQSVDQLRKLIVPDVLVNVIEAGADGLMEGMTEAIKLTGAGRNKAVQDSRLVSTSLPRAGVLEKLREEVDDILASSCVLCERSLAGLDLPFVQSNSDSLEF